MKIQNLNKAKTQKSFSLLSTNELAARLDLFKILPVIEAVVHLAIKQKSKGYKKAKALKKLLGLNGISKENAKTRLVFRAKLGSGAEVKLETTASKIASFIVLQRQGLKSFLRGIQARNCHLSQSIALALNE
jgi:hypothetical protein